MRETPYLCLCNRCICSTGRQNAQVAITHGLQYVESELMRALVVYLAVSMVIQMAEGSTWLSNCEPTWCLSAPLTACCVLLPPPPPAHSVMYSSQPFKVKCHLDCESCLVVRLDSHLQLGIAGQAFSVAQQLPGSSREIYSSDRY